jgi:CubicO group peptidase (beta-lactamase class C family)
VFRWASVTKLVTALAALIAAEEGVIDLDEPAGPEGSTVRHLLAHASGLPFEPAGPPGSREAARLLQRRLRDARGAHRHARGDAL